jgi:hypothetical protein
MACGSSSFAHAGTHAVRRMQTSKAAAAITVAQTRLPELIHAAFE